MDHLDDLILNEHLDGVLDPARQAEADAHLAVCVHCQNRYVELRALFLEVESLPDVPLGRDLSPEVAAAVTRVRPALALPRTWQLAFAAQAGLALVLLISLWPNAVMAVAPITTGLTVEPVRSALTRFVESLSGQWQSALASAQSFIGGGWESVRAFLPASLGLEWGAGLAAVSLLWLMGNGLLLRLIPRTSTLKRSRS